MPESGKINYRKIDPTDLEICVDLYRTIYRGSPFREKWKHSTARQRLAEVFDSENHFAFGAWEGPDLVGFCMGRLVTRSNRYTAQIEEFGIEPDQAQDEIARGLMQITHDKLGPQGVSTFLQAVHTEDPAFKWLQDAGFHISQHYVLMVERLREGENA